MSTEADSQKPEESGTPPPALSPEWPAAPAEGTVTAEWSLERAEVLLSGQISITAARDAHELATAGLALAVGSTRTGLLEVAIATALFDYINFSALPMEYESWVDEAIPREQDRLLATLPAVLARNLDLEVYEIKPIRDSVHTYQHMLFAGVESMTPAKGVSSLAPVIHELSFYIASIQIFDITGMPGALLAADRFAMLRNARAEEGREAISPTAIRFAMLQGLIEDQRALPGGDPTIADQAAMQLLRIAARIDRARHLEMVPPTHIAARLKVIHDMLACIPGELSSRAQLESVRLLRMHASSTRGIDDMLTVIGLLGGLIADSRFNPDEVRSDLIRAQADRYELTRDRKAIVDANDLANQLLDAEGSALDDPEILSAISMARLQRYREIGLLVDLEEAYAYNQLAQSRPDVSGPIAHELQLNGSVILRNLYGHSRDENQARRAADLSMKLIAKTNLESGTRRSALFNFVSLGVNAQFLTADAPFLTAFEAAAVELRAMALGEPRFLVAVAQAMRLLADGRRGFVLAGADCLTEAMCNASGPKDLFLTYSCQADYIDLFDDWIGPPRATFDVLAMVASREMGVTTHLDASAALLRRLRASADRTLQPMVYEDLVRAARQMVAAQVSGAERRHLLQELDGLPSAAIVDMGATNPEAAVVMAEATRALVGAEALSFANSAATHSDSEVGTAFNELRKARLAADFTDDRRSIHEARLHIQSAQQQIRDLGHERSISPLTSDALKFSAIQDAIESRPVVYLAQSDGAIVALLMTASGEPSEILRRQSSAALNRAANQFLDAHKHRRQDFGAWASAVRNVSAELWNAVIGPIYDVLRTHQVVTVVPCGRLALLPIHLAWRSVEGQRRHLLEDLAVQFSPGASFGRAKPGRRTKSLPSFYGVASLNEFRPLPFLAVERESLTSILSPMMAVQWSEPNATPDDILNDASKAQYLHLAAHGQSRLHAEAPGYVEVGSSRLDEPAVLARQLDNLDLVVLSSCDSGAIDAQLPDEVRGLPLAFIAAGVDAVVAANWQCDDLVTTWLMSEFYEGIAADLAPAVALATAQARLRSGAPLAAPESVLANLTDQWLSVYCHEVYWGAFSITGKV